MSLIHSLRRSNFRTFVVVLCTCYLLLVLTFQADLDEASNGPIHPRNIQHHKGNEPQPQNEVPGYKARTTSSHIVFHREGMPVQTEIPSNDRRRLHLHPGSDISCSGYPGGKQYQFVEVHPETYVYSAYWDQRSNDFDNLHNMTIIRLMAVLKLRDPRPDLSCHFQKLDDSTVESPIAYYEMCENHGRLYGGFILSCVVPPDINIKPCGVRVSSPGNHGDVIRVRPLRPQSERHRFGICIPPLFGSVDPINMIEFIELNRLLGSQHFMFYDYQMPDSLVPILLYYQRQGIVSVLPWQLPGNVDKNMWYHGQLVSIQDCLYHSMPQVEFLTFNDIDEYIVPHKHAHWGEMMGNMFDNSRCGFRFYSGVFPPVSAENGPSYLKNTMTLRSTGRSGQLSHIRTKCMVKPTLIFEKGIHHVSKPIYAHLTSELLPGNVSFIHHYRRCVRDFGMDCSGSETDDYLLRYSDRLLKSVNKAVNQNIH